MHLVDHLFLLIILVIQPIYGAVTYRRYVRSIEAGGSADRPLLYRHTFFGEWAACIILFGVWIWQDRPFVDLGLVPGELSGVLAGLGIVLLITAAFFRGLMKTRAMDDHERREAAETLGDLVHFLPHDAREYRYFAALSLTAGFVEEIIYRAFLFWYLGMFMPLWAVVIVSSILFGLAHSYQGLGGMLKVTLMGLAAALLYVVSGTIWIPMLAHALVDILQGLSLVEVLKHRKKD